MDASVASGRVRGTMTGPLTRLAAARLGTLSLQGERGSRTAASPKLRLYVARAKALRGKARNPQHPRDPQGAFPVIHRGR